MKGAEFSAKEARKSRRLNGLRATRKAGTLPVQGRKDTTG